MSDAEETLNSKPSSDGDCLRERIAAVIYYQDGHSDKGWAERTADAVIAELGLSVTGGVIVGCLHEDHDE